MIVVDNASNDESASVADRFGATVVRNTTNRGFAVAANQGVALGDGELVLLLNPDAVVDEANLTLLVEALKEDGVGIAGPRLIMPDGSEQRPFWPFPSPRRQWRTALAPGPRSRRDGPGFVVGACLLTTRSLWDKLGGLDESFWLYGEEADFCRRAFDLGYRAQLVEAAAVDHIGGVSGKALGEATFEHFVRGSERFVFKHHGTAGLVSYRLGAVVRHGLRSIVRRGPTGDVDRANLRRSAHALRHHPTLVHVPDIKRGNEIILASLEPWDDVWRRNQFLVRELTQADPATRVLWVEPAHDALHAVRSGFRRSRPRGRLASPEGYQQVTLFQPTKLLPRRVWPWTDRGLSRQVRRVANQLGFVDPVLWLNDSSLTPLTDETVWPVVYDITDDWLDFGGTDRNLDRLRTYESILLRRANRVVVCSPELAARRGSSRSVVLIPNAVDTQHFQRPRPRPTDLPPSGMQTAVYVGSLHRERVDVELVVNAARELPAVSFVFVGPDSLRRQDRALLATVRNVALLGPRPYDDVPAYLQHADVIIIPHVVSPFTESLDPIKAYEVLAVGRPCVATPVAGFREIAEHVTIADRSSFADAVARTLENPPPRTDREAPSWRGRATEFAAVLEEARDATIDTDAVDTFRVVYLDHCAKRSGGELALLRLLSGFTSVSPTVLLAEDGDFVGLLREAGVPVEVIPLDPRTNDLHRAAVVPGRLPFGAIFGTLRYCRVLRRRVRELDPDIIHTNSLKAMVYGSIVSIGLRSKLIWHVRDRIADDYLPRVAVVAIRAMSRFVPDAIIANSTATMRTMGAAGRTRYVAPSTVVFDAVPGSFQPRASENRPFTVGMVGRLAPWKGQDIFLRAFAEAFPNGPARAVIAGSAMFGEDDFANTLAPLAEELGITDRVSFRGFVDDVATLLGEFDVLVHASVIPEPFGQVVVEGMAAGIAVVASNAGGPAEIITEGVDGILVEPGNVGALARTLRMLEADPGRRRRLGDGGRVTAAEFAPERIAAQVEAIYRRVTVPTGPLRRGAAENMGQ